MTSLEIKRLDKQSSDREIPILIMNNNSNESYTKSETLKRQTIASTTPSLQNGVSGAGGTLVRSTNTNSMLKSDNDSNYDDDDKDDEEDDDDEGSNASPVKVTKRQANNSNSTESQIKSQLQFNKYGFLQPSLNSSMDTSLQRLSSTSTNIKSTEYLNTSSSTSLAGGQNGDDSQHSPVAYNNTNYKERMQSIPIEFFAEQIPIDVVRKREIKWLEMLNNYNEWMNKRFVKLKNRCRKGMCLFSSF
jgi:hypothetical protein